jgi:uncharacterized membrane protein
MTATLAPSSWPGPAGALRGLPWLFGREVVLGGLPGAPRALQWLLQRNCSITPRQLGRVYLSLCGISLLIAGVLFAQGAKVVLAFTSLELVAVGFALLVFARHAADRETLTLVGRSLRVEQCIGHRVERTDFAADWLSVEPAAGQGSLVQLSGRGQRVHVGRFLRPELRSAFARELRQALRRLPAEDPRGPAGGHPTDSN